MPGSPPSQDPSSEHTRIIRRAPAEPPARPSTPSHEPSTGIIRRTPTGSFPAQQASGHQAPGHQAPGHQASDPRTTHIPAPPTGLIPTAPEAPTGLIPAIPPGQPAAGPGRFDSWSAIATCVAAMLSGWAVSVVATDLITGWWQTDRLFCLGVGFLTFVFAAATVSGVITVLLRRTIGRYLITTGAVVALLTFGAVFIAGAKIAWPVYLIPVLPVLSVMLAFLPGTGRWSRLR